MNYLELIITSTFVVFFAMKTFNMWGLNEWYALYRKNWMPNPCDWCWSFWLSVLITSIIYLINPFDILKIFYTFIPMITTAIISLLKR